jgi:perosamine synthetase
LDFARSKITKNTKAILIQHTFGIPVDITEALELANEYGLIVIEDCVHALGTNYKDKNIGTFGHAAFFSTEETKIISTTMGGMITTDKLDIAEKMKEFQK